MADPDVEHESGDGGVVNSAAVEPMNQDSQQENENNVEESQHSNVNADDETAESGEVASAAADAAPMDQGDQRDSQESNKEEQGEETKASENQGDNGDDGEDSIDNDSISSDDDDDEESSSEEESDDEPSSQNVAQVTTEDGHTLSQYELQRLERIRRNNEYLASLGLEKSKPSALRQAAKKPNPARKKRPDIKRRSSISRATKDKKITYSERKSDKKEDAKGKEEEKEPWVRPKENRSARMERFIHDEFRRIGKEQRHHLKRAQTNVRKADVEYRIAKQRAERVEKKRSKELFYQQSAEKQGQERRALGGLTARGMLQEVDSRMHEIYSALRNFDERFNPEWAKQQEENSRKMELIDAMDRFPRLLKDSSRDLDVLLVERAPRDPPPPRRGTRKRKGLDSTDAGDMEPDAKARALESPDGKATLPSGRWGSLSSAVTAETLSSAAGAISEKPSPGAVLEDSDSKPAAKPKKKKKDVIPKIVGGWVSPAFSADIDRSWLEADSVPKKFEASSYIPQVGDTVLYYPAGHRDFLKANPDVLGKKTRNITRLTLWDRARKEKAKLEKAAGEEEAAGEKQAASEPQDSSSKGPKWWSDEWLSLIDGDLARYPILCRVEKTHAEFPPDPNAENKIVTKDDASGGVQVTWGVKKKKGGQPVKKTQANPSLRLAVMLRPLTSVMPPHQGEGGNADSESLALAPNFYVVTFPTKEAPYLLPFSWAYRLSHSLADGTSVRLSSKPDWRAKVQSFKPLESGHGSSRLDDKMDSVKALCNSLKNGPKSFAASLEEALSGDKRASIPLTDACAVIERFEAALEENDTGKSASSQSTKDEGATSMMMLIRSTLPLWNEVLVGSGSGRKVAVSAWELSLTDSKAYVPTGPLLSISADIEMETGLIYSIDESLRAKIECTIEDFLRDTPDSAMFCPLVSDEDAPSYSCAVPRGMAFNKILQRLRTGKKSGQMRRYYRSIDSLLADLSAIVDNCILYNSVDSFVVEKALEVVPAVKRLVSQVASQHFKEKEAIEKSVEERRQAIALQLNGESQQDESAPRSRGRTKRQGLPPPYTEALHRSWLQDTEPDGSWAGMATRDGNVSAIDSIGNSRWVPQSGDTIFYSRSLHTDFVKGHHPSLTTEQCELPTFSEESDNASDSEVQDVRAASRNSLSDELQNRWIIGKVVWVRSAFPRAPSKRDADYENTFEVASPVLDLGIRFNYSWASNKIYKVSWRPCTFARDENADRKPAPSASPRSKRRRTEVADNDDLDVAAEESTKPAAITKCGACHLNTGTSFVRPAWIPLPAADDDGGDSSTPFILPDGFLTTPDVLFARPAGVSSELIGSIDRCLNVLKRRCLDGVPANHVDSRFTAENVKKGWSPPAPKIGKSLPTFDRVLAKGNSGTNDSSTRGVEKIDKKAVALLADANYLPQWTSSLSGGTKKKTNRDGIAQSLALHETLSPTPNFCLELIQTRLRNGYYRSLFGLAHDIQEAYVSSVILLLAKPSTAKMGQAVSIRRIAKALSAAKDNVSFAKSDGKKAAKGKAEVVAPSDKNAVKSGALSDKEQEWVEKILQIRALYGTALACVYQPAPMERIFGSVPRKKAVVVANETIAADREQVFRKARNTLGFISQALQRDPCDNRPSMSWNPSVKVRVRFSGQDGTQGDDEVVSLRNPIVLLASDYESNESLVKFFFGKPLRMGSCGRCSAYGRSTMLCRVRKNHSRPDFDWVSVFQGTGGIDGLLYTLRTGQPAPVVSAVTSLESQSQPAASLSSDTATGTEAASAAVSGSASQPDPLALLEKAEAAVSFADKVLKNAQKFSNDPVRLSEEFVDSFFPIDASDGHYNYCILCGLIGDVICCEGCPNVVHPHCVNLSEIPEEDWFCSRCQRKSKIESTEVETSATSQKIASSEEETKEAASGSESQDALVAPNDVASSEEKKDVEKPPESQEPISTVDSSSEDKHDAANSSESQKPSAIAESSSEAKKDGETSTESKEPSKSEVATASAGADVLPPLMAAPYGLDDDADRLETMLAELKSARPIRPKKPKKKEESKESTDGRPKEEEEEEKEEGGEESSEDEDEPSSQAPPVRARRATRRSSRGSIADGGEGSASEDDAPAVEYQVGPQPKRIRVGMRVKKSFGKHGYFSGRVLEVPSSENPFYLVRYSDDDEEDMTEEELRKCILGPSANRPNTGERTSRRSTRKAGRDANDGEDSDQPAANTRRRGTRSRLSVTFEDETEEATAIHSRMRTRSRASAAPESEDEDEKSGNKRSTRTRKKRRGSPMESEGPKKRGRPSSKATAPPKKRGRGRPRKHKK